MIEGLWAVIGSSKKNGNNRFPALGYHVIDTRGTGMFVRSFGRIFMTSVSRV